MLAETPVLGGDQQPDVEGIDARRIDRQPPEAVADRVGAQDIAVAAGDHLRRRREQIDRRRRVDEGAELHRGNRAGRHGTNHKSG